MPITPKSVFEAADKAKASDVHMVVGSPLLFRIDGVLTPQGNKALTEAEMKAFVKKILGEAGYKQFVTEREVDSAYGLPNGVRLRINCHFECGLPGLVARLIPQDIPDPEAIGLAGLTERIGALEQGLVLFTGSTGAGKSTSLASLIQSINLTQAKHIITLEDPIEFIFKPAQSVFTQRQLGQDFHSFAEALRRVLRQDPDIVMVGEMRDLETIAAALTLAETGHLIFATLHTPNAVQTIDRIIDVFPPHQQAQIRAQLSLSLRFIVAQRLIPGADGKQVAHREVVVNTAAVSNIIRDNRVHELKSVIQSGVADGMCSFERHADLLYKQDLITKEVLKWAKDTV